MQQRSLPPHYVGAALEDFLVRFKNDIIYWRPHVYHLHVLSVFFSRWFQPNFEVPSGCNERSIAMIYRDMSCSTVDELTPKSREQIFDKNLLHQWRFSSLNLLLGKLIHTFLSLIFRNPSCRKIYKQINCLKAKNYAMRDIIFGCHSTLFELRIGSCEIWCFRFIGFTFWEGLCVRIFWRIGLKNGCTQNRWR